MFNKLMKEFNSARKNGTIDKVTHQQKFTFSFPELGIENVDLLLHKTALDQRFKVNVLLNLNDRRSIIFPDEEIDRARCIIGVCAPIANYDIAGHNERERLRKDAIEQMEFFVKQLINADVGSIPHVDEVANHHIIALAVSMASSYSLFYALWVPRQIEVCYKRAGL